MSLVLSAIFGLLGFGLVFFLYKAYKSEYELTFAYTRYLQAYKIKVLRGELIKRGTTFEELDKIGFNHTSLFGMFKNKKTHDLDSVEKSVKGEVAKASAKVSEKK